MINLRFVNVVWGDAFTDTFVNVCLPSTLTGGNLEFVAANSKSSYRLYTTPKDAETILRSKAGKRLSELMPLEIVRVDAALPVEGPNAANLPEKYSAMSLCHTHFIKTPSTPDEAAMVFLSPDTVWADGSFRRLFEIAQSGKRLVMLSALRLAKEGFVAALREFQTDEGALKPLGNRELVGLAMQHLHPETESLIWGSVTSNIWPSILIWKNQTEGVLVRAFHMHPLMVRPIRADIFPAVTIDDDYIAHVCPNPADEYIVRDSGDILTFELSRRSSRSELIAAQKQDTARIAQWAHAHANPKHQSFFQNCICMHATELSETWSATERFCNSVAQDIRSRLAQGAALVRS